MRIKKICVLVAVSIIATSTVGISDANAFSLTCYKGARPFTGGLPNPTIIAEANWTIAEALFVAVGSLLSTAGGPGGISAVNTGSYAIIGRVTNRYFKHYIATYPGPGVYSIASQATASFFVGTWGAPPPNNIRLVVYDTELCGFAGAI